MDEKDFNRTQLPSGYKIKKIDPEDVKHSNTKDEL